ncbi:MAG: sulfurtransferase [Abditibacteriales bacterium]|nr:sulfurtransferase [Abditibacteriales bacterium]MDW8366468.1 sulfurtransferase [Abditibacteriales bacterium]
MADYARPEVLVSTEWVAQHTDDPTIRLVEVDVDTSAYDQGHIKGAIGWNWTTQLCDQVRRDILTKEQFEKLMSESGIANDTTVVLYGDNNNWFATYAFWQMVYWGHPDDKLKIMNGGRQKWIAEGRELVKEVPTYPQTHYRAAFPDDNVRATKEHIFKAIVEKNVPLVDVRSPQEFTGEILAPPGLQETAQRGGHIPGAINIPWGMAMREDNTFKSADELKALYEGRGVTPGSEVIAYCRIGERSSHTWFVLKYLLGYPKVRNYDGSWTEWGNLVGAPIEKP